MAEPSTMHIPPASDAVLSTPPQPPSPPSAPEHKPGEPSAQPLNPDSGSSTSSGGGVVPPSPYSRLRLSFLLAAVYTSVFLIALDQLIVSTAVPAITDEFGSLRDIGWYGSAYLLTSCSFQLVFGRVYTFYPVRPVYVVAILLFEVGSAICGAAGGSAVFIVGRGIQGVGAAGIYSGSVVGIVYAVPLHQRPIFMGLFGAVSGVASILGPLVGGAFTSNVTWRWCFYLNLPFGAVSILIIAIVLQKPLRKQQGAKQLDWKEKLSQLDVVGTLCLVPGVVSILLALQWGGSTYSWNDRRIIALLVLGGVLLVAFIVVQILTPETATVPSRIFKQRSIYSGAWVIFFIGGQMNVFLYFIPIWFQAIQGVSAVESGIRLLPFPLATIIASILVGIGATASGYYTPFLLLGSVLMAVGAGLLTTWQVHTSMSQWVGYQVLYGLGIGMGIQAPNLAAQTVLPLDDVATGTALMLFNQLLGGAIFVSVGQSVFTNGLVRHLSGVSGFDSSMVRNTGTEGLSSSVPPELKAQILVGYNEALRGSFQVGLILASLTIIGALGMQWRSVKSSQPSNSERREALDETVGNH